MTDTPDTTLKLKGATRLALRQVGSLESAAGLIGIRHAHLSRCQLPDHTDTLSIAAVARMEALAGVEPHVTRALAALTGHVLVPAQRAGRATDLGQHLAQVGKETGEVLSSLGAALLDGRIDDRERADLLRSCDEAESAIATLRAAVNGAVTGEGKLKLVDKA